MKRTTSMSEIITFDLNTSNDVDPNNLLNCQGPEGEPGSGFNGFIDLDQSRVLATVSPRNHTKHFEDLAHTTPDFLRTCSLCKRRLVHGRDIYMYRGDSGFCSVECREQQMNQDERKDKCHVASKKQVTKGGTVVAL